MSDQTTEPDDDNEAHGRTADQPLPNTQAPRAGERPDAGLVLPAEKSEPSGVPVNEQRHNADPNAPQSQVVPPGQTQQPPGDGDGVPASSRRQGPDDGAPGTREAAQVPNHPPPAGAGEGDVRQTNDPNESHPRQDA